VNRCRGYILPLALAASLGCAAAPARYVNQEADLSAVKTVAVLPFENVTNDKLCAVRIEKILLTELLSLNEFHVVEPGQVARALRRDALDVTTLTTEDFKRLGESLKVEMFVLGTVLEYEEGRGTVQGPRVRLVLRMVDAASGATVWSASPVRGGVSLGTRLLGLEGTAASELAQSAIHDELVQLTR
jgi:TolB-like protein